MKRIVICCDGTWNSNDRADKATNVWKLCGLVLPRDGAGVEQAKRYYAGVGSRRFERFRGGALGWGLSRNIEGAYVDLVGLFEPGDELFLFGFSRGAYTTRSLAGLIRNAGILKPEHVDQADAAYELYRDRDPRTAPRSDTATEFRRRFSHETRIRFIGVWDTVGSLGIPKIGLGLVNALFRWRWAFHDVELSTAVDFAYQALAVDERRGPFRPAIWRQRPDAVGQTLEQVWFAGVHSDVGGGYPESGLSDGPLRWMLDRAAAVGLALDRERIPREIAPDPLAPAHDSLTMFYRALDWAAPLVRIERARIAFRRIGARRDGHESIASSVVDRRAAMRPRYDPSNVRAYLGADGKITDVRWGGQNPV